MGWKPKITKEKIERNPMYRGLIAYLWEHGAESPSEIRKNYAYTADHLNRILSAMFKLGYVEKTIGKETNMKHILYSVTEKSKFLLKARNYYVFNKPQLKDMMGDRIEK